MNSVIWNVLLICIELEFKEEKVCSNNRKYNKIKSFVIEVKFVIF